MCYSFPVQRRISPLCARGSWLYNRHQSTKLHYTGTGILRIASVTMLPAKTLAACLCVPALALAAEKAVYAHFMVNYPTLSVFGPR